MNRIPMTPEGFEKLKNDLNHLRSVVRPQNIKDIETAREHGDISENAEFSAAKEKQSLIAGQIAALEDKISRVEVIDPKTVTEKDRVVFGAQVTVYDQDNDQELSYTIVGDDESDAGKQRIGVSSPIARGLIGKRIGDEAVIATPKGKRTLEVVKVAY